MPAHLDLAALVTLNVVALSLGSLPLIPVNEKSTTKNSTINDVVYLESKDVLLQMLEKKLKEIKDHKKRNPDFKNGNGDVLPKNVDIKLKSNGISAVGDSELLLRYGSNGQGAVNLLADGISNVGKVQLTVAIGENGINIPGLNNLFAGPVFKSNDKNETQLPHAIGINSGFRRQSNDLNESNATNTVDKPADAAKVDETKKDEAVNATTGTSSTSIDFVSITSKVNDTNVAVISSTSKTGAETITASTSSPVVNSDNAVKSNTVLANTVSTSVQNINAV